MSPGSRSMGLKKVRGRRQKLDITNKLDHLPAEGEAAVNSSPPAMAMFRFEGAGPTTLAFIPSRVSSKLKPCSDRPERPGLILKSCQRPYGPALWPASLQAAQKRGVTELVNFFLEYVGLG